MTALLCVDCIGNTDVYDEAEAETVAWRETGVTGNGASVHQTSLVPRLDFVSSSPVSSWSKFPTARAISACFFLQYFCNPRLGYLSPKPRESLCCNLSYNWLSGCWGVGLVGCQAGEQRGYYCMSSESSSLTPSPSSYLISSIKAVIDGVW